MRSVVLGAYQKMFLIYCVGALVSLVASCLMPETLDRGDEVEDSGLKNRLSMP